MTVVSDGGITAVVPPMAATGALDVTIDFGGADIPVEMPQGITCVDTGHPGDVDGDGLPDASESASASTRRSATRPTIQTATAEASGVGPPRAPTPLAVSRRPSSPRARRRGFFTNRLALLSPGNTESRVLVRALKSDGTQALHTLTIPPTTRATIDMGSVPGLESAEFGTVVSATGQVIANRTLTWAPAATARTPRRR